MACAFRPRLRPNSMASRYGSQKLLDETHLGLFRSEPLNSTPNPVITSFSLAGFEVAFAFPLEKFSGLGLGLRGSGITGMAGFAAPKSVITSLVVGHQFGYEAARPSLYFAVMFHGVASYDFQTNSWKTND
jgi:hypothetical protein